MTGLAITHATTAIGSDSGSGSIHKAQWNAQHTVDQNLVGGFNATAYNAGIKSSGSFTPDPANGNMQYYTNSGAHVLQVPSTGTGDAVSMIIQVTNSGTAGVITTSAFTWKDGDALTTVSAHNFMLYIAVINGRSHLSVVAMQ